jgi:hypothetical protein
MLDLPPLDGDTRSWAVAISNTGFIAGISECLSDRYTHAVVWTTDSTPPVINIASPGPSDYLHSDTLVIDFSASDSSGLAGSPTAMLDGTPVTSGGCIHYRWLPLTIAEIPEANLSASILLPPLIALLQP